MNLTTRIGQLARLRQAAQNIRASYWFIPACLVVSAMLVAWFAHLGDRVVGVDLPLPDALNAMTTGDAKDLMSTIASAMIGVAGVMFSLTLVAVTHAAGQYGPRLIGNFMRDRGNQWSLGILLGIFVYALLTLALVSGKAEEVARLSVALGLAFSLVGVGTMIFFIHHVPETVNVANITSGLGRRLATMVRQQIDDAGDETSPVARDGEPDVRLSFPWTGYIQAVSYDRLRELAEEHDFALRFAATPGDFVTPNVPFLEIWGDPPDEDLVEEIMGTVAVGPEQTETQAMTFIADQLVEMVALALSPGINDPFTAINCLNWITAALEDALTYEGGLKGEGEGRIVGVEMTFEELYAHTYPAALPYIADDAMARQAAIERLDRLMRVETTRPRDLILRDLRRLRALP